MRSCFQGCSTSFDWMTYVHLRKELPFGRALLSDKVECAWDKNATWVIRSPVGLLQITPSPSSPPQLCLVVWEHCWREASLPLHFTSSIAKSLETGPKWESVVIIPPRKPSILGKKKMIIQCINIFVTKENNLHTTLAVALPVFIPSSQTGLPLTRMFPSHSFFPPTSFTSRFRRGVNSS